MKQMYFKLFANCIPVKGYTQSLIYDLPASRYEYIPNILFEILKASESKSIEKLKQYYNNEYDRGIDSYFNYLISKELGFYTSEPELYPRMDLFWETPFDITNCILHDNLDLLLKLKFSIEVDDLTIILSHLNEKTVNDLKRIDKIIKHQSLQLFIKYDERIYDDIKKLNSIGVIAQIIIFNASETRELNTENVTALLIKEDLDLSSNCNVNPSYFSCNIPHFTEAQTYNTYFNRKLYIDPKGNLKNAPNSFESFGSILDLASSQKLFDILNAPGFTRLHKVGKDRIETCKDCEYRYMCVDNRAPVQKDEGMWYNLGDCNYNPFTGLWKNE